MNLFHTRMTILLMAVFASLNLTSASASEFPKTVKSAPCRNPPTIDGSIDEEEWKEAPPIEFDLPVLNFKTQKIVPRTCQWRAMNSANGLYIALRVPDATLNKSLSPLDFDFASLAFCRGSELVAGDDRKAIAPGIYLDKHFTTPGKDVDDKQVDGKGAMLHDKAAGVYTIEWAMPLDSGDAKDIQAKPGDKLRFNLAYIDAFQPDLKQTQIGSAYPGGLDQAKDWGTLQLAADVQHDGGATFRGPEWVRKYFESFSSVPADRLRVSDSSLITSASGAVAKVLVEYNYREPQGKTVTGKAKLYVPTEKSQVNQHLPLLYSGGYELDDASAVSYVGRGFAVVTPRVPEVNPLVRTVNPDVALLHIARSLPFVDDARVVVMGGSAGGYITLMLAAETFPLCGAAPAVPPVNWGYNAAYFLQRERGDSRKDVNAPKTPVFDAIVPIVQGGVKVYGADTSDETYFRHSPVAHLDTVTCPVSVYWTTADMLVPIDQVGKDWVRPFDATKYPVGFTFDPEKLTTSKEGQQRLIDALQPADYEVFVLSEDSIKQQLTKIVETKQAPELPISATKRWSITILDEGAPEPQVGHTKHPVPWSQAGFISQVAAGKIAPGQLTLKKLQRMMDRYASREWLPTTLTHLDTVDNERADVVRGLRTYISLGGEHKQVFNELYGKLSADQQVLSAEVLKELQAADGVK